MPLPYSYTTQGAVLQEIANRLYDPTMTFWTQAELSLYLNEALQTWNALTGYWRGDFTFPTVAGELWYDLTTVPNTLRPYTVTDVNLYVLMQYHFLEPPTGIDPWPANGSKQFTSDDFLNAVQRRRDEILSITGCTQAYSLVPAVAGRIALPDRVIDVRRMAYLPSPLFPAQSPSVVWPDDTWAEQSFNRNYTIQPAGVPLAYLMSTQPPISFDTDRPPAYSGNYELLTVNAGSALNVNFPSTLLIPDDWTHVLKWGAMADLLSREWDAKDLPRAAYCESRYRLGVAAMLTAPALLAMRINNVGLQIDSVRSADLYDTSWEGSSPFDPPQCFYSGMNMIAINPSANTVASSTEAYGSGLYGVGLYNGVVTTPWTMTATVVENALLPANLGAYVQVGRDDLDVIIDMAQHLAMFKSGGAEFAATMPLLTRFLKQAGLYNGKLRELGEYQSMLSGLSSLERGMNPVSTPDGEKAATSVE
jgi:hypothetical protein